MLSMLVAEWCWPRNPWQILQPGIFMEGQCPLGLGLAWPFAPLGECDWLAGSSPGGRWDGHDAEHSSPALARILSRHGCQPAKSLASSGLLCRSRVPDRRLCPAQPWAGVCTGRCHCYFQRMHPLFYCMLSLHLCSLLANHVPLFTPLFTHHERKKRISLSLGILSLIIHNFVNRVLSKTLFISQYFPRYDFIPCCYGIIVHPPF